VENPAYPGYLYRPKGATSPLPGILLLHGSEGAWGDYWGPQSPVGEEAPAPYLAKKFAEAGFAAYALAYFDNRHASPAPVHVPKELAFIDLEYTYKAMKWFRESYAKGERLVLLGHSRGAEQALLLAGLLTDDTLAPARPTPPPR
jgi:dienelactone hydrolase